MTTSKRKRIPTWALILAGTSLIWILSFFMCWYTLKSTLGGTPAPKAFPQTDLVFGSGGGESKVGFVNADGSGLKTFRFRLPIFDMYRYWVNPILTADGEHLFLTNGGYRTQGGLIYMAHPGEIAVYCNWQGTIRPAADGRHIWLDTSKDQELYLPDDCGMDHAPIRVYRGVTGALSPDEQFSAEARYEYTNDGYAYHIVIRHIETNVERMVGGGNFPVWSPDGRWLAYTGAGGIYLVENTGQAQTHLLVKTPDPDLISPINTYSYAPPIASWSPDGKWLVYHLYHNDPHPENEKDESYYSIVKTNVETGETIEVSHSGISPFWRYSLEASE